MSDATEAEAQQLAAIALHDRDASIDWRAAGYSTARRAAEVMVGSGSGRAWERAVEIVTKELALVKL